jgi:glycosyltransferase involved in cell wall biosynthesis
MNILFLAPQPVYQDRGSPIAIKMVLEVMSRRGDAVDVITYHEGRDFQLEHVRVHRIPHVPFVRNIRPGFSWKKLVCDIFLFFKTLSFVARRRYQVVYAVEEAAFIALFLKLFLRIPYVYDMDSSLAQQMVEKYPWLGFLSAILRYFEGVAIRHAKAVIIVCDALEDIVRKQHPQKIVILRDVPLLQRANGAIHDNLCQKFSVSNLLAMYVGNLEVYQGIDLLLESFALASKAEIDLTLVVVGGEGGDIQKYQKKAAQLGIQNRVHFLGQKPIEQLSDYLSQADILLSPRIKGHNTPMKIYSYLDSGKPVLATDLWTHTQVLDHSVAVLTLPLPEKYAQGLIRLAQDADLRKRLGDAGKKLIAEKYNYTVFLETLTECLDWLSNEVAPAEQVVIGESVGP